MKIFYKLTVILFIFTLFTTSCVDESKFPIGSIATTETFVNGAFVTFNVTTSPVLDVTDIDNAVYGGVLEAPSDNVASYDLSVRSVINGTPSDYFPLTTITSFPSNLQITAADLANTLGVTTADFPPGTRFDFEATSTGKDGSVLDFEGLNSNLQGEPGQHQSYRFVTFISCPFDRDASLGTYQIIDFGFARNAGETFEVVAGENDNQLLLIGPYEDGFDVIIEVESTGLAVLPPDTDPNNENGQEVFNTDNFATPGRFENTRMIGNGFVFSCTGFITFTNNTTSLIQISDGANFGFTNDPNLVAQKL